MSQNYYYKHGKYPYSEQNYTEEEMMEIMEQIKEEFGGKTLPTKTSDLTNDSGFITLEDVPGKYDLYLPVHIVVADTVEGEVEYTSSYTLMTIPCNLGDTLGELFQFDGTQHIRTPSLYATPIPGLAQMVVPVLGAVLGKHFIDFYYDDITIRNTYVWNSSSLVGDVSKALDADFIIKHDEHLYFLVNTQTVQ